MNYIYNIYLNFNKIYFDFYEWKDTDNILHIKKIPIIKINTIDLKRIISNYIKINDINKFLNKTEINNQKNITCLIITDSKNIYAIKFDKNGFETMTSSFNLEDEYNILQYSKKLNDSKLNYEIIKKKNYIYETRDELTKKKYLLKEIHNISFDTIKYIYYECFNKEENNYKLMINQLLSEINKGNICNQIYNILKPISTN